MSAGLPATGIGGALYMLLIVWMVAREVVRTAPGNSSKSLRWSFIGKMVFIFVGMLLALVGEWLLIQSALELVVLYLPRLEKFVIVPSALFVLVMAASPFAVLCVLVACVHCLRFLPRVTKARLARRKNHAHLRQALSPS